MNSALGLFQQDRVSRLEVFLSKELLKICFKITGEHPCRSMISVKLLCNFIEITLRHRCCPVNLLHIFRTPFPKNTSGGLLLTRFIVLSCLLPKLNLFWAECIIRSEMCPYSEFFWSVISHIGTEYREILRISFVSSSNAGKCGLEKLRIWSLFPQFQ